MQSSENVNVSRNLNTQPKRESFGDQVMINREMPSLFENNYG